ncbi:MAG: hypothetical protein LWX56_05070 [Ignavibacteria bacterium]|nr:hypothetical protein [Ignavibacteria bacterium]
MHARIIQNNSLLNSVETVPTVIMPCNPGYTRQEAYPVHDRVYLRCASEGGHIIAFWATIATLSVLQLLVSPCANANFPFNNISSGLHLSMHLINFF